jgi:twinkle protein
MGELIQINQAGLSPAVVEWFKNRRITEQTLIRTKTYSVKQRLDGAEQNVIVFPFISDGKIVNEKYRASGKKIWQKGGGEKVFWNDDIIDHPDLQSGKQSLVITEGEIDALSFVEIGYPFVVSVPNGALPPTDEEIVIPEDDVAFSYIKRAWKRLANVKRIILAVDADPPGQRLKKELAIRLGEARCYVVSYPEGCKDANDVLKQYGPEAVYDLICDPSHYPISGLYTVLNLPPEPDVKPFTTGWGRLDDFLMVYTPAFMVVTGKPNEGKSTWTTQLAAQLAIQHDWNVAIASFEMIIQPFMTDALRAVYRNEVPEGNPDHWLEERFNFIIARDDDDSGAFDVDWLLERAEAAWIRRGIKVLIIDPWNEVDHSFRKNESHTDYIGRIIRKIKRFAQRYGILIIVVAHPTKGASDKKKAEDIDLFDIADSAHFHNKADMGVVIARLENSNVTNVFIKKIRFQPRFGKRGMTSFVFSNGTFGQ